jgi:hypothetical protein
MKNPELIKSEETIESKSETELDSEASVDKILQPAETKNQSSSNAQTVRMLRPGLKVNPTALRELKEWKKTLIKAIQTQSRLVFDKKGEWSFILPTVIVKLVWNTTIKERIKYEESKSAEGATKRAVESLKQDFEQLVSANKLAGAKVDNDN